MHVGPRPVLSTCRRVAFCRVEDRGAEDPSGESDTKLADTTPGAARTRSNNSRPDITYVGGAGGRLATGAVACGFGTVGMLALMTSRRSKSNPGSTAASF